MRNPSIAPNRRVKGTQQENTLKQLSKHILKSNNTITAAGNGKPVSSIGRETAAEHRLATGFKSGLGVCPGSY